MKLKLYVLALILTPTVLFASASVPDIPKLNGLVIHSSVSQSLMTLSDSEWKNCTPTSQPALSSVFDCDVVGARLTIGEKEYRFVKGRYFGPSVFAAKGVYDLFTTVELAHGFTDDVRLTVVHMNSGDYRAEMKFTLSGITEKILIKD